jgi:hypothetical protein
MSLTLLFPTAEETRKQNFHTLLMLPEKAENPSFVWSDTGRRGSMQRTGQSFFFTEKQPLAQQQHRRSSTHHLPHSRRYRNTHLACVEVGMHLICEHPNEHHKVYKELATRNGTATPIPAPEDLAKSPHERLSTSK